jgi:hypothetical protein
VFHNISSNQTLFGVSSLFARKTACLGRYITKFRGAWYKNREDGSRKIVWKDSKFLPVNTASHSRIFLLVLSPSRRAKIIDIQDRRISWSPLQLHLELSHTHARTHTHTHTHTVYFHYRNPDSRADLRDFSTSRGKWNWIRKGRTGILYEE